MMAARKRFAHGVALAFNGDMDRIDDWLAANCAGGYAYGFDGVKENGDARAQLRLLFSFEDNGDKERFKRAFLDGLFNDG